MLTILIFRELEQSQMQLKDAQEGRGKEKEIPKFQQKETKCEELAERSSVQLSVVSRTLEEARLQWEGAMYRYSRGIL